MKGDDKSAYYNENCYTSDDLTGLMTTSDWEHQENDADEDAKGIIQHFDTYAYLLSFWEWVETIDNNVNVCVLNIELESGCCRPSLA